MAGFDLALPSRGLSPHHALELALEAEQAGWAGVWLSEVLDLDALVMIGIIAAQTERVRLGTAVVPVTTRSAATLAMAASTIARLAPGRFSLGVGVSTPVLVEQRHDRPVRRPLRESRGTIEVVRAALAGERVDHDAEPAVRRLRIGPPEVPPRVLLAALGPRMTDLAVSVADGLVLNLLSPSDAGERAASALRSRGERYETLMLIRTVVDPTPEEHHSLRREITGYLRVPAYGRELARAGQDVEAVRSAPSLDDAVELLSDELLDAFSVAGTAEHCVERLEDLRSRGVTPLVVPASGPDAAERTIASLGPSENQSRGSALDPRLEQEEPAVEPSYRELIERDDSRFSEDLVRGYVARGEWRPQRLDDLLWSAADARPDHTAVVEHDVLGGGRRTLTYESFADLTRRLAAGLRSLGVGEGDVVSVMLPNRLEFAAAIFAIFRLGAVYSGIPTTYGPREVSFMLGRTGARVLLAPHHFRSRDFVAFAAELIADGAQLDHVVVVEPDGDLPAPQGGRHDVVERVPAAPRPRAAGTRSTTS
jgi:probable F420-dependent oxidoreductase